MDGKHTYQLVNPKIYGEIADQVFRCKTSGQAAINFHKHISEHTTGHIPMYFISIINVDTGRLRHFMITEKRNNNDCTYCIEQLEGSLSKDMENRLIKLSIGGKAMIGGNPLDDSSSSSSSSFDDEYSEKLYLPISRYVYYNLPYYKLVGVSRNDLNKIFVPVFGAFHPPTVEINFEIYRV